jgi:hypothetical protein
MSLPTKNGAYIARPLAMSLEQKTSGSVQVAINFKCDEYIGGGEPESCNGDGITSYFNLVKLNGQLNEINIRSLRDSLGWDGASFATLVETDWSQTPVQIVVDDETKQDGSVHKTVKYINPRDYKGGGGVGKTEPAVVKSLDAKFGSMLRAMATPKPSPRTGQVKPAAEMSIGKDVAWAAFLRKVDEYGLESPADAYSHDRRITVFRKIVGEIVAPKDPKTLQPSDWLAIKTAIETDFSAATESIVPY